MANQEYEWPNCWIRGHMEEKDYQDDPVRLAVIKCPYRKGQIRTSIFGSEMDYKCHHPAIESKDDVEGPRVKYGGIMMGGSVDDFKTFCIPVDMHLTSLGEKSQLIIEGTWSDATEEKSNREISDSNSGTSRKFLPPKNS